MVFDVTNSRSYQNLKRWMREIAQADKQKPIEEKYIVTGDVFHTTVSTSPALVPQAAQHSPPRLSRMLPTPFAREVSVVAELVARS